jgi:hypothetical protein
MDFSLCASQTYQISCQPEWKTSMRLFAVRVIKDKQPVGIFWAPDPITLWWMIDSVCDPGDCEFVRIKDRAAIVWEDKVNVKFGARTSDEADDSKDLLELREKLSFEYALGDLVYGFCNDAWKKVPFADEPSGGIHDLLEQHGPKSGSTQKSRKSRKSRKQR